MTKLFVLLGPSSPRLIDTASGEFVTPSVVTPPPEFPVRVTAPPELISTNLDTVALMLTVPVVDCPRQLATVVSSNTPSTSDLMSEWGIEVPEVGEMWVSGQLPIGRRPEPLLSARVVKD